jgi:hypothetical protein
MDTNDKVIKDIADTSSIRGEKYLIDDGPCNPKCPNHPDFDKSMQFAHFCPKCYYQISKKHKPVLKPLQLKVSGQIGPGVSDTVLDFENAAARGAPRFVRERCHICNKRLPFYMQKKYESERLFCEIHSDENLNK